MHFFKQWSVAASLNVKDVLAVGDALKKWVATSWPDAVWQREWPLIWAVSELGMSLRELVRRLEMSSPGVVFSVERGETIARENGLQLIE